VSCGAVGARGQRDCRAKQVWRVRESGRPGDVSWRTTALRDADLSRWPHPASVSSIPPDSGYRELAEIDQIRVALRVVWRLDKHVCVETNGRRRRDRPVGFSAVSQPRARQAVSQRLAGPEERPLRCDRSPTSTRSAGGGRRSPSRTWLTPVPDAGLSSDSCFLRQPVRPLAAAVPTVVWALMTLHRLRSGRGPTCPPSNGAKPARHMRDRHPA